MKKIIGVLIAVFGFILVHGQETLPNFTITERNDKVIISWTNPYPNIIQLNIQRSYDSLRYFATVFSPESPSLPQNGFTDNTKPNGKVFYRIFFVLIGGDYYFTKSKRAGIPLDGFNGAKDNASSRDITSLKLINIDSNDLRLVTIKLKESIYRQIPANAFRNFRDSVLKQTKDTLFAVNDSLVVINPYVQKEVWRASRYVFVNSEGFINISLPKVEEKKFRIHFFEDDGKPLFEINHVRESPLILDKSSFIHSGWFNFELYEDGQLKEKNKFYLPKDF